MTTFTLYCVVEGESTSFPVEISSDKSIGQLKKAIKLEKSNDLRDVDADKLTLWKVSIPVIAANKHQPVLLSAIDSPTEIEDPTDDIADVFTKTPPKKTIHIIVQRPSGNATHCSMQAFSTRLMESRHQSKSQL